MTITQLESSLQSAKLVQEALLPKRRHFNRLFEDSFVFYSPKEILSGDFYWVGQKGEFRIIIVGDCTGHGISAALVSVLALNLFEYVVMNKGVFEAHKILEEVEKRYIESFKDVDDATFDNPWIDLSVICINDTMERIQFASANRKVLHVIAPSRKAIYKSTGYPLGGWQLRENRTFEPVYIPYLKGSKLYLGSDGFQDQFGGPLGKKYGSLKLHEFLAKNSDLSFSEQREKLRQEFIQWIANEDQTDDICVVGVKI